MLTLPTPLWENEDGSGGGGETTATETTETAAAESTAEATAYDWGEVPDEVGAFINGRDPVEVATEGLKARQAASKRSEKIIEESGLLQMPDSDAGDEAVDAFLSKLRPESADVYGEANPEKFGEGADDSAKAFMAAAHEAGMTPHQFQKMAVALEKQAQTAAGTAEDFEAMLQDQHGDEYDKLKTFADRAYGDMDEGKKAAMSNAMQYMPKDVRASMFEMMADFGQMRQEGAARGEMPGGGQLDTAGQIAELKTQAHEAAVMHGFDSPQAQAVMNKLQAAELRAQGLEEGSA